MRNFKTAKIIFRLGPTRLFLPDKAPDFRIANGLEKSIQLVPAALGHHFNPSIRQISDSSRHLETVGQGLYGIAKPDALDVTGVKICYSLTLHGRLQTAIKPRMGDCATEL